MRTRLLAIMLMMLVTVTNSGAYQLDGLKVDHLWSRATPHGAKVGAGYLTILNTAAQLTV